MLQPSNGPTTVTLSPLRLDTPDKSNQFGATSATQSDLDVLLVDDGRDRWPGGESHHVGVRQRLAFLGSAARSLHEVRQ